MTRKIISVLLCVALTISVAPIVSAQSTIDDTTPVIYNNDEIVQVETEPYIVGEIVEKRTEDTKHFLMSDRSVMAAMYNQSVHYEDNGAWVDIDNSFSTNAKNEYENKSNSFKTKFSKKSNGNKLVTVTKDNYSLSWMLDDANKVNAQVSQPNETENEDISVLKNLSGTVTYPEIQNDVDLQYVVSGENIKENIILQSTNAPTEYSFTYKFNKLNFRTNSDNKIELYDENAPEETVFTIEVPYMYDSANAYSNDIEMQIAETSNGFTLTLIPDKEWLLSEDRVYPIVVDPTTFSSQDACDIWDITLYNAWADAYNFNRAEVSVGSNTSSNIYRTLLKFEGLPNIGNGGIIVNAKLYLTRYYYPETTTGLPTLLPRPTDDIQVNIHRITSSWPEINPTWIGHANNYNPIVEDYFIYNDTDDFFSADITNLVSDWYDNPDENYGIMLKAENETAANHVMQFASSDFPPTKAEHRPCLTVNYRVCIGLEDYWSYTTQDMGGYGTGYVNDYNGNLTYIHDDVSFNSLINGFTLSHVYNSANTVVETTNDNDDIVVEQAPTGRYGKGWGLNLVQRIDPVAIENTNVRYVYTDGDGTKNYFIELDDGTIVDEDGLGYTLNTITETTDSGSTPLRYKITTKDGVVLKFDECSFLRRIIDTNGNTINLNYSPGSTPANNRLTSITTSSGGTFVLNYDSNSNYLLTSIKDNANRVTSFEYDSGNLKKITYPDGTYVQYEYSENKLCQITLPDNKKICYFYYPNSKISAQNIKSASGNMTAQYCFYYFSNKTEIIDLANRKLTYQFDSFGRVTCAFDAQGNSYSQSYEPTSSGDGIFKNNKLNTSSNNVRYINNLITNPVFSDDLNGWGTYSGGSSATSSVVADNGLLSSNSILVATNDNIHSTIYQTVNASGSQTYTLSAYMKLVDVESSSFGAGLEIVTSNGRYLHSEFKTGTTDTSIDNGFEKISLTVQLQDGEYIYNIGAGLFNSKGSVYIDSVQLEEGDTSNKINLISNSSFENGLSGYTTDFGTSQNGGGVTNAVTFENGGNYSMSFVGDPNDFRSARQTVNVSGEAGDVFSYGGWAKANSIPKHESGNPSRFEMCVNVYYTSGQTQWFKKDFNVYTTEWQYLQDVIVMPYNYTKLEVSFGYDYNCNNAYFDNIFLYHDTSQSYTYDDDGNVISTSNLATQNSNFEYENNNLKSMINPDGTSYTYTYDNKNNLTDAESNVGVKYHMTYDGSGNVLSSEISSTDSTYNKKITSSATYQNNNNHPRTITDSRGNTTTYTYDAARGLQTGVTDALDNTTEYNYNDLNDRLEYVTSGNSTVQYNYYEESGRLMGIQSPSATRYAFIYDEFGRTDEIYVEQQSLINNEYTARGLLDYSIYGNGHKIGYTYDLLDRVTEKLYNNIVKVKFRYDKFGNLYEKQDLFTNTTYRYNYDLSGRLSGVKGSNNTSLNYVYDNFNRVKKFIAKVPDNTNITEYIYGDSSVDGQKDGLIYGVKQNGTQRISYGYDALARLDTRTLNTTTPFVTGYTYHQGATANTTTTLVKTMQNGSNTYEYAYDAVGNITQIKLNGQITESYTYDSLNQLKTETRDGNVYEYAYDNGGNIQSVKRNGTIVKDFTYDDENWYDLLTSYNGMVIQYDEIGNPTLYWDGSTLNWSNGRQLTSVSYGIYTIQYGYNADGLRTTKNDGGAITEYYWLEGTLLGEKTGNDYIIYLYDENGSPYGFINNNTYYYYVKNVQGDIVGILDASGNQIVQYKYSAWGEVLSVTGTKATTIGQKNPLRYRGYYYDSETGLYYLQSRYYDPMTCRFINADSCVSTGQDLVGCNMFAYCGNNPVNRVDGSGEVWHWAVIGAIGAAINVASTFIAAKATGQEYTWLDAGVAAGAGFLGTLGPVSGTFAAVGSGIYTGIKNYRDGASVGKSILSGAFSAFANIATVGNLAELQNIELGKMLKLGVDSVFGFSSNIISSSIDASVTYSYTANNTSSISSSCFSVVKNSNRISNTRIVDGNIVYLNKNSTYMDNRYANRIYCKVTLY